MFSKQFKWLYIAGFVVVIGLVIGGGVWWRSWEEEHDVVSGDEVEVVNEAEITDGEGVDTSGWKIYKNDILQYQFNYPPIWSIDSSNPTHVKVYLSDSRGDIAARVTVEIEKKERDIELLDWIGTYVEYLSGDLDLKRILKPISLREGEGWEYIAGSGHAAFLTRYIINNKQNDNVYIVQCVTQDTSANFFSIEQICFNIGRSFDFIIN